jgi:hypothetical protein
MAKMMLVGRGQYLRLLATGWVGGFFLCRTLELRHASPRVQGAVEMALAIVTIIVSITFLMTRQPRFLDHDKDMAALVERLCDFLDRHHLWNHFLAEDPQGKR